MTGRAAGIAGLVALMLLMAAAGLCGQHFREVETAPVILGGYREYVKGVYIVKNAQCTIDNAQWKEEQNEG